jgi:hypothetical protein
MSAPVTGAVAFSAGAVRDPVPAVDTMRADAAAPTAAARRVRLIENLLSDGLQEGRFSTLGLAISRPGTGGLETRARGVLHAGRKVFKGGAYVR